MNKLSSFSLRQSTPTKDVERMIQLIVRFGDGDDLSVRVAASSSVLELKALIGEWKQALAAKYLRLVYRGRILHDSMALATLVPMATDVYSASTPLYLHCAVSDAPVSDRQEPQMNANEPALGFDRLIDVGFSRQEVANLRTQFHSIRGRDEQHDLTRTAEEAWIDNDNRPRPDSDASTHETHMELLVGLCCGFFGGILALFWIKEQGLFSRRQQMGIIVGLVINVCYGLLRFLTS